MLTSRIGCSNLTIVHLLMAREVHPHFAKFSPIRPAHCQHLAKIYQRLAVLDFNRQMASAFHRQAVKYGEGQR